ncbi:MAG: cytochrome b [Pseudomonadota bacterium]
MNRIVQTPLTPTAAATHHRSGPRQTDSYSTVAKLIHWTTAIAVLAALMFGVLIGQSEWPPIATVLETLAGLTGQQVGSLKNQLYDLHRSFGTLVLGLIVLRVCWWLVRRPPPLPAHMSTAQRAASFSAHSALYVLLFVLPILGWVGTSLFGAPIIVFGLFELPPIVERDRSQVGWVFELHTYTSIAITAIVALHIGAALKHRFIDRDGVFQRMTFGR